MKKVIRLTECDLRNMIMESISSVLEDFQPYISDKSLDAMSRAFCDYVKGSDILSRDIKVVRGEIVPDALYSEEMGVYYNGLMPGDVVIEYPGGWRHTLIRKVKWGNF